MKAVLITYVTVLYSHVTQNKQEIFYFILILQNIKKSSFESTALSDLYVTLLLPVMVAHGKMTALENENPLVFQRSKERMILPEEEDENIVDKIDDREVFGKSDVRGAVVSLFVCKRSACCSAANFGIVGLGVEKNQRPTDIFLYKTTSNLGQPLTNKNQVKPLFKVSADFFFFFRTATSSH